MTKEQPGDDGATMFPAVRRRRRKAPWATIVLALVAVIALGGGGAWVLLQQTSTHKADASAWVLPEGVASMGEAEQCLRERELPCAEADMLAYLKKYPADARATALLAITLTQDGRHKEALYYYRKAEGMGIATYDFHAGYARTLDAVGDTDRAIPHNQAALKLSPRLVDVRGALADELVKKGRAAEGLDLLQSFDRQLESEGYPPYFEDQVKRIEVGMGGDYAKAAAEEGAAAPKAAPGQTLIPGEPEAGTLVVPVSIDGAQATRFTVDSGASLISLPYDDAEPFLKLGLIKPGDYRGVRTVRLANGSTVTAQIYNLRSVKVGDREVTDVLAAVYPGHGPRLLGQSFLKRFRSWSVDNSRRMLVLTD